jgi:hypothetical protein
MTKQFFTWVPFHWNHGNTHVDTHLGTNWKGLVTIKTTQYSGQSIQDARHVASIEHELSETLMEKFLREGGVFGVTIITEEKALELLNAWYPVKEEHAEEFPNGYFEIVSGEIVDNTPYELPFGGEQ